MVLRGLCCGIEMWWFGIGMEVGTVRRIWFGTVGWIWVGTCEGMLDEVMNDGDGERRCREPAGRLRGQKCRGRHKRLQQG